MTTDKPPPSVRDASRPDKSEGGSPDKSSDRAPDKSPDGPRRPDALWSIAFTAGFTILAGLAVGYYGGRWLDARLHTAPWLSLVGTILGIVAGFRVLLRDILGNDADPRPGAGSGARGGPGAHGGAGPESGSSPGGSSAADGRGRSPRG